MTARELSLRLLVSLNLAVYYEVRNLEALCSRLPRPHKLETHKGR